MDRDANYAAVGGFIVLIVFLASAFFLWLNGNRHTRHMERYAIDFHGAVNGLGEGSPVRYLGVSVGNVVKISLLPDRPGYVRALIETDETAPIRKNTIASIRAQGITGLSFIQLEQGPGPDEPVQPTRQGETPVIASRKSELDKFIDSAPALLEKINLLVARASSLFDERNLSALAGTLENIERGARLAPGVLEKLGTLMNNAQTAILDFKKTTGKASGLADAMTPKLEKSLERIASITARIDRLLARNEDNLSDFAGDGLAQFKRTMAQSEKAAEEIKELARSIRENPSQLITRPNYHGVEIKQ